MDIEIQELLSKLDEAIELQRKKPTKAQSARIRKISQQLSNELPIYRRELINLDKAV